MSKNLKLGFSLVEVMLLFAVLAIILAATTPIVTKKVFSISPVSSHGAAVCIGNPEGGTDYYRLNGNSVDGPVHNASQTCTFTNLPQADKYRIDMYSGGAGGTNVVQIDSVQNGGAGGNAAGERLIRMNDLIQYVNNAGTGAPGWGTSNSYADWVLKNQIFKDIPLLNNDQLAGLFDGMVLTLAQRTGNSGNGKGVTLKYRTFSLDSIHDIQNSCAYRPPYPQSTNYSTVNDGNDSVFVYSPMYYMWHAYNSILYDPYNSNRKQLMLSRPAIQQWLYFCTKLANDSGVDGGPNNMQMIDEMALIPAISQSQGDEVSQSGGIGAGGTKIFLDYKLHANQGSNEFYTKKDSNYPFLHYMADLVRNKYGHGYKTGSCNSVTDTIGGSCSDNAPTDGRNAEGEDRVIEAGDILTAASGNTPQILDYLRAPLSWSQHSSWKLEKDYCDDWNSSSSCSNTDNSVKLATYIQYRDNNSSENLLKGVGKYYYIDGPQGGSPSGFAAFRIPPFTGGVTGTPIYNNVNSKWRTVQTKLATGARGRVGIQTDNCVTEDGGSCNDEHYSFGNWSNHGRRSWAYLGSSGSQNYGDYVSNYAYRTFVGSDPYQSPSAAVNSPNGKPAEFRKNANGTSGVLTGDGNNNRDSWNYYKIRSGSKNLQTEPMEFLEPALKYIPNGGATRHKAYKVGKGGGNGQHVQFETNAIAGATCTANVPKGGDVLTNDNYDNQQAVSVLRAGLAVSIVCKDASGNSINMQPSSLSGGEYSTQIDEVDYPWEAREDDPTLERSFERDYTSVTSMKYDKPLFSKLFDNIVNLLSGKKVAQGGSGVYFKDNCNVFGGQSRFEAVRLKANGSVNDIFKTLNIGNGGNFPNTDYSCYPGDGGRGIQDILDYSGNGKPYNVTEATKGGPGAVIISW